MKELICIVCPNGCHLKVDEEKGYAVTGNRCARGAEYGRAELLGPKTDRPVPKGKVFDVMEALKVVELTAPVTVGQVVIENVCGTGANVVATRGM